MFFKQLFDQATSTYTYLLADLETREAVIIDPVIEKVPLYLKLISDLSLELVYTLDTHIHADHVTGSGELRKQTGALSVVSAAAAVGCVDRCVGQGDRLGFGRYEIEVRSTPGHTNGCVTYVVEADGKAMAFTGDTIFINGCGRTDFQEGDARTLFRSVSTQIFSLPDDTVIFPGHDYHGFTSTTVEQEKAHNPRLKRDVTEDQFVKIMDNLNLGRPKMMNIAVPANRVCGQKKNQSAPTIRSVSPKLVPKLIDHRIIDVREKAEFEGPLGHIERAELMPLSSLNEAALTWSKDQPLLLVCGIGKRSERGCRQLAELGFTNLCSLEGGMAAWNNDSTLGSLQ